MSYLAQKEKRILRSALLGESPLGWKQLFLTSVEEADTLLRVNEYHLEKPRDLEGLQSVHNEAIGYLNTLPNCDLSQEVSRPEKIQELFLLASNSTDPRLQRMSCGVLKVMNIINFVNGRELLYNVPISLRDLHSLVEDKIERELSSMARHNLLRYAGGRKQKESVITRLITKKDSIAAQFNDRVRYQIVTPKREDIPKTVLHLFDSVLPYNYVVPAFSVNRLIRQGELLEWHERFSGSIHKGLGRAVRFLGSFLPYPETQREYSGGTYRVIKFLSYVPVRLDRFAGANLRTFHMESLGNISYVQIEIQIVDEATNAENNAGNNERSLYKDRQRKGVLKRLF